MKRWALAGAVLVAGLLGAQATARTPSERSVQIHFVNLAHLGASRVQRLERALLIEANRDLHRWWQTPPIRFGATGWGLRVLPHPRQMFHAALADGHPYAVTDTDPTDISHELVEMLVDPTGNARLDGWREEVVDPVNFFAYAVDGVELADFVSRTWFARRAHGPWDFAGALKRAGSCAYGFAYRWDRGGHFFYEVGLPGDAGSC